ncbi:MAG TPA: glycerophosphodiester phosphodiesterase family protein [Pyrinomonadaceae bacterium]|jgi:glycerophosphoryl diester phosphodiesterase
MQTCKPLIIAHRGASALAPENTLAAFEKALTDGAEGLEFDVQMARDGVPVVFHDFNLKRIGGCDGAVSDFSSAELRNIDAGTWFNLKNPHRADEKFSAERIPTFLELLGFLKDYKGLLYVELKCAGREFAPLVETVCRTICKSEFLPQIRLKSFNLKAIAHAKKSFPEIRTAALFEPTFPAILRGKAHLIEKAEAHRADELSLHFSLVTKKLMARAAAKNFPVTIWTADNPAWVNRAIRLGLQAIITNNPARLISEKRKAKSER